MKSIIGVKFCGHCNPIIDGPQVIEIIKRLEPELEFVSWQEENKDILLILSGCLSDCAIRPQFDGPVINVAGSSVELIQYSLSELPSQILKQLKKRGVASFD